MIEDFRSHADVLRGTLIHELLTDTRAIEYVTQSTLPFELLVEPGGRQLRHYPAPRSAALIWRKGRDWIHANVLSVTASGRAFRHPTAVQELQMLLVMEPEAPAGFVPTVARTASLSQGPHRGRKAFFWSYDFRCAASVWKA